MALRWWADSGPFLYDYFSFLCLRKLLLTTNIKLHVSFLFFKIRKKEKIVTLFEIDVYSSYTCVMKLPKQSCVYDIS